MNDAFKWLLGRLGKEKRFLAQPRSLPHKEDSKETFVVSQEFYHPKKYGQRVYMISYHDGNYWDLLQVSNEIGSKSLDSFRHEGNYLNALSLAQYMTEGEKQFVESGWLPLENDDSMGTYQRIANKAGIHFDKDGNPYDIRADGSRLKDMHLGKDQINDLFKEEKELPTLETWQDIYHHFVNFEETDPVAKEFVHKCMKDSLYSDAKWATFKSNIESLEFLKATPDLERISINSWRYSVSSKVGGEVSRLEVDPRDSLSTFEAQHVAKKLLFSSLMIHFLRGGAMLYQDMIQNNSFGSVKTEVLQKIGEDIVDIAESYLGFKREQIENIANIMTQGDCPFVNELPLFKILDEGDVETAEKVKSAVEAFNKAITPPPPPPVPKAVIKPAPKAQNNNSKPKKPPCGPSCTCR